MQRHLNHLQNRFTSQETVAIISRAHQFVTTLTHYKRMTCLVTRHLHSHNPRRDDQLRPGRDERRPPRRVTRRPEYPRDPVGLGQKRAVHRRERQPDAELLRRAHRV